MGAIKEEEKLIMDEICKRRGLSKEYFKTKLHHMEKSYQERKRERFVHHSPYEEERVARMAELKWDKRTTQPQFFIIWEMLYMLWLWLTANIAVIFFSLCFTLLYWTASIQSIAVKGITRLEKKWIRFTSSDRPFDMIETFGFEPFTTGMYYFYHTGLMITINFWAIADGGFKWSGRWRKWVKIYNTWTIIFEAYLVLMAFIYLPSECDVERFREYLLIQFQWYGILAIHKKNHGEAAVDKIHALQAGLGCCGMDSYLDYQYMFSVQGEPGFNRRWWPPKIYTRRLFERFDENYYMKNGRDLYQIPNSCCNPMWRNDIYCAYNIIHFESGVLNGSGVSLAQARLNQKGCAQAVFDSCTQLKSVATWGMFWVLVGRIGLCLLIYAFTPLIYKSVVWKLKWLWTLTEGRDGLRYLPAVTQEDDICMNVLRQPNDRFDPKLFRWRARDHINVEVPREGIPLQTLVKLDDLPSEEEFKKLRVIEESTKPEYEIANFEELEKFQVTKPSLAYREMRNAQRRRGEIARFEALKVAETFDDPGVRFKRMLENPPDQIVNPEFTYYPVRKTIHHKVKPKDNADVPPLLPPPKGEMTPAEEETRRLQNMVHVDMRFDWEAAILETKAADDAKIEQVLKNQELKTQRQSMNKGIDPIHPWIPVKKELEMVQKRMIAADEDDEPPPMWDPRNPDEGKGGFLQPMQEYEIRRAKALAAGEEPPDPPVFDKRPPMALTGNPQVKLAELVFHSITHRKISRNIMRKPILPKATITSENERPALGGIGRPSQPRNRGRNLYGHNKRLWAPPLKGIPELPPRKVSPVPPPSKVSLVPPPPSPPRKVSPVPPPPGATAEEQSAELIQAHLLEPQVKSILKRTSFGEADAEPGRHAEPHAHPPLSLEVLEPIPLKPAEAKTQIPVGRKTRPGVLRKTKLGKSGKSGVKLNVAIRRSVHSIGDVGVLPRKSEGSTNIPGPGPGGAATGDSARVRGEREKTGPHIAPHRRKKVRRRVTRVPTPIAQRPAWH